VGRRLHPVAICVCAATPRGYEEAMGQACQRDHRRERGEAEDAVTRRTRPALALRSVTARSSVGHLRQAGSTFTCPMESGCSHPPTRAVSARRLQDRSFAAHQGQFAPPAKNRTWVYSISLSLISALAGFARAADPNPIMVQSAPGRFEISAIDPSL